MVTGLSRRGARDSRGEDGEQRRESSPSAWVLRRKVWTRSILVVRRVDKSVHLEVVVLRKRRTVVAMATLLPPVAILEEHDALALAGPARDLLELAGAASGLGPRGGGLAGEGGEEGA